MRPPRLLSTCLARVGLIDRRIRRERREIEHALSAQSQELATLREELRFGCAVEPPSADSSRDGAPVLLAGVNVSST